MTAISAGDVMISGSILISAIGATWRIGNRFAKVESKLDSHIAFHAGTESKKFWDYRLGQEKAE